MVDKLTSFHPSKEVFEGSLDEGPIRLFTVSIPLRKFLRLLDRRRGRQTFKRFHPSKEVFEVDASALVYAVIYAFPSL